MVNHRTYNQAVMGLTSVWGCYQVDTIWMGERQTISVYIQPPMAFHLSE